MTQHLLIALSYFGLGDLKSGTLPKANADETSLVLLLNVVLAIVGALALLMIVISGLRYILSAGDPQKTSQAKQGILYALVGLVIAIMAQVIVSFIVRRV